MWSKRKKKGRKKVLPKKMSVKASHKHFIQRTNRLVEKEGYKQNAWAVPSCNSIH